MKRSQEFSSTPASSSGSPVSKKLKVSPRESPSGIVQAQQDVLMTVENSEDGWTKVAMTKMWKLDSFMKESQRMNGVANGSSSFIRARVCSHHSLGVIFSWIGSKGNDRLDAFGRYIPPIRDIPRRQPHSNARRLIVLP